MSNALVVRADKINPLLPYLILALQAVDSLGNPVVLQNVEWSISDGELGSFTLDDAGNAVITLTGATGNLVVSFVADGDPVDDAVHPVLGSFAVRILPGIATEVRLIPRVLQDAPAAD